MKQKSVIQFHNTLELLGQATINAILFNSEAWHNVEDDDLKVLETIDEHLLRSIVQGRAKTPLEFLYLETGAVRIRHIISGRRIMYLQSPDYPQKSRQ